MLDKIHPIRATLAISAWGAILYMAIAGHTIPDGLWVMAAAITGLYFGTAED